MPAILQPDADRTKFTLLAIMRCLKNLDDTSPAASVYALHLAAYITAKDALHMRDADYLSLCEKLMGFGAEMLKERNLTS